jgi:hypothetical protein
VLFQVAGILLYVRWQSRPPVIIANYRADFQSETPKPGWQYLWNAAGELGHASHYAALVWNGSAYNLDGAPNPRPMPAKYMGLDNKGGGHPGQGHAQHGGVGNETDRYVLAAFTVPAAGRYFITNSSLRRHDGESKGQVLLRVFVNDTEVEPGFTCDSKEPQPFDRALGQLKASDTIYVGVGPDGMDYNDSFAWDFSIAGAGLKRR